MDDNKNKVLIIFAFIFLFVIVFEATYIFLKHNDKETNNTVIENKTNTEVKENNSKEEKKEDEEVVKKDEDDYLSSFKENDNTVIDYDLYTSVTDIDFEKAYQLVVDESSKLKQKKNISLFDIVGRVNKINNYYYVNYDVNYYNLPKDVYESNIKQIKTDKEKDKLSDCKKDKCTIKITKGYKNIKKYLVKNAYYYYVFDGSKKVSTTSIMNLSYLSNNIPDEWLKLGNYKNKDAMIKDCLLMIDEKREYKNYLVVYDTGSELKIKYKGKSKTIVDKKNYTSKINDLYDLSKEVVVDNSYVGGYSTDKIKVSDDQENDENNYDSSLLYLRSDGTFLYDENTLGCGDPLVGTYTIEGKTIKLVGKVRYGCDACFNTKEDVKTLTATIVDSNTLEITDEFLTKGNYYGEEVTKTSRTFKKDKSMVEDEADLNYYVVNPKDGVTPKGSAEAWINCTH